MTAYIATQTNADFNFNRNYNVVSFNNISGGEVFDSHWDFGDGNTSNLKNPIHTYQANGVYDVKLFISNSCSQDSIIQQVAVTTSTNDLASNNVFQITPNPAADFCTIKAYDKINLIQVFDVNGKLILNAIPNSNVYTINVSGFSQGVYFVKVTLDDTVKTQKLIRE